MALISKDYRSSFSARLCGHSRKNPEENFSIAPVNGKYDPTKFYFEQHQHKIDGLGAEGGG